MAQNDMPVIIYKILAYLYACLKEGKTVDFADLQCNSTYLNIPRSYWDSVIEELVDNQLIKGLKNIKTKSGTIWSDNGIRITLQGVEFLENNSSMKKAKKFLGESFQTLLSSLIEGLISKF